MTSEPHAHRRAADGSPRPLRMLIQEGQRGATPVATRLPASTAPKTPPPGSAGSSTAAKKLNAQP